MRILAVGGGSGGHVTPVVAVFKELKDRGEHELRFWCDRKFGPTAKKVVAESGYDIPVSFITAGKLRRYHGESKLQHLAPSILFPNLYDLCKVIIGFVQSFCKLLMWRPDVIFIKGGYVCLPVGYAARLLRIPLVLHDSDAHPGLTNRLLSPFAKRIGTGAPLEYYRYSPQIATYVGVPISDKFRPYTDAEKRDIKAQLGFDPSRPLVVVTGGGLGAVRINNAVAKNRDRLLETASVFLISGQHQYNELSKTLDRRDGWRLESFLHGPQMAQALAAADVVVARAGATTLLELAALGMPTVIIPNGRLTAGHQLKNAKVYQDALAAVIVNEDQLDKNPDILGDTLIKLLRSPKIRHDLGSNFLKFAKPHAAGDMAEMILEAADKQGRRQ